MKAPYSEDDYWHTHAFDYTKHMHTSLRHVLHPTIAEIVNLLRPSKYLDFGCGDGRLAEMIDPEIPISLYDLSRDMLRQATERLGNRVEAAYTHLSDIPANTFEIVVSSLVLMCIDNDTQYTAVLHAIARSLTSQGKAILAVTHPCFRQYPYSDHFTAFATGRPFHYHHNGEAYDVTIHDAQRQHTIVFQDYHWTLSYTINKILECNLKLERVIETEDDKSVSEHNAMFPPFILFVASKS